jgi:hypothetical protein
MINDDLKRESAEPDESTGAVRFFHEVGKLKVRDLARIIFLLFALVCALATRWSLTKIRTKPKQPLHAPITFRAANPQTTPRAGWVLRGIPSPESVAEHSHRMTVLALSVPDAALLGADRGRLAMMAAVHDMAEALVGDITPQDGVPKAEKCRRERAAMHEMLAHVPDQGSRRGGIGCDWI